MTEKKTEEKRPDLWDIEELFAGSPKGAHGYLLDIYWSLRKRGGESDQRLAERVGDIGRLVGSLKRLTSTVIERDEMRRWARENADFVERLPHEIKTEEDASLYAELFLRFACHHEIWDDIVMDDGGGRRPLRKHAEFFVFYELGPQEASGKGRG